jgi:hypothetical protein
MIEPPKTHASHEEYIGLKPYLGIVGKNLEECIEIVAGIDGG